ncbi:MAG TPA: hypothetical protein VLQ45_21605 [Thermoanaerobaculia bacterium]|nr:hypothetical protein [Thermoanaerobaculia bacterium]
MNRLAKLGILMLSLGALAFTGPTPNAEASCHNLACFASPACCNDRQCDDFCGGAGLGFCGPSKCCSCQG